MQDRPTKKELLAAVQSFLLDEIVPSTEGRRQFLARVAANALKIVDRELDAEDGQLEAEWAGLDRILGRDELPSDRESRRRAFLGRNEALCALIRSGAVDEGSPSRAAVVAHVRRTVRGKLQVTEGDKASKPA